MALPLPASPFEPLRFSAFGPREPRQYSRISGPWARPGEGRVDQGKPSGPRGEAGEARRIQGRPEEVRDSSGRPREDRVGHGKRRELKGSQGRSPWTTGLTRLPTARLRPPKQADQKHPFEHPRGGEPLFSVRVLFLKTNGPCTVWFWV